MYHLFSRSLATCVFFDTLTWLVGHVVDGRESSDDIVLANKFPLFPLLTNVRLYLVSKNISFLLLNTTV